MSRCSAAHEILTAAAALRTLADAADSGPWQARIHQHRKTNEPVLFEVVPVAVLEGNGDGGVSTAAAAEYIAAMQPAVARAIARLLDEYTDDWRQDPDGNPGTTVRIAEAMVDLARVVSCPGTSSVRPPP